MNPSPPYDVIIIGGSYAGLSVALALGRSLREVLVIDSGRPCNRFTPHSQNFLTRDGASPAAIREAARLELQRYPTVHFLEDHALEAGRTGQLFELITGRSGVQRARKLVLATGITDELPDLPGFPACWGRSIIHCPYCHGYEWRGRKTGILANGERALHLAGLVHQLSKDLVLITGGKAAFTAEQKDRLHRHGIPILETGIETLRHDSGALRQVHTTDGATIDLDCLYAALPFTQHSSLPQQLGCALTEHGHIGVDPFQRTSLPGVYACGDNSSPMRSVANAVSTGNLAGAMVNKELVDEEFG